MTNDHGETPFGMTAEWTTVGSNGSKKQATHRTQGQTSEKSNQNHQAIGEIEQIIEIDQTPQRVDSSFITRINYKVIPTKDLKTISVPNSICRIIAAIKEADKNARIITVDEYDNEAEFHGSTDLQKNINDNQEYVNKFTQEPRINKSNQLVGLIILRSELTFKEVKKHQVTQKKLNDNPRIFLTVNQLDVVTPTAVGFFINTTPRPDKPESSLRGSNNS